MDPNMRMKLIQNLMELLEGMPDKNDKPEGDVAIEIEPKGEGEEADAAPEDKLKALTGKGL